MQHRHATFLPWCPQLLQISKSNILWDAASHLMQINAMFVTMISCFTPCDTAAQWTQRTAKANVQQADLAQGGEAAPIKFRGCESLPTWRIQCKNRETMGSDRELFSERCGPEVSQKMHQGAHLWHRGVVLSQCLQPQHGASQWRKGEV